MKTAGEYIETVYGTANLARSMMLGDAMIIIDVMQDYGDYVRAQESEMLNYIMDIDAMTTTEFCHAYEVPLPKMGPDVRTSVDNFLQINAVKERMFTEKAKELYRKKQGSLGIFVKVPNDIHPKVLNTNATFPDENGQ